MANHPSARRRVRRNSRRFIVNRMRLNRIRTFLRKVEVAINGGIKVQAQAAFRVAVPELMRGVNKGIIHRNKAARKISRLSAHIKTLN